MQYLAHVHGDAKGAFAVRPRTTGEIIRRVAGYLRPYPLLASGTIVCALLGQLATFAYPKLTRFVMDDVIGSGRKEQLGGAILGLLAAFASETPSTPCESGSTTASNRTSSSTSAARSMAGCSNSPPAGSTTEPPAT